MTAPRPTRAELEALQARLRELAAGADETDRDLGAAREESARLRRELDQARRGMQELLDQRATAADRIRSFEDEISALKGLLRESEAAPALRRELEMAVRRIVQLEEALKGQAPPPEPEPEPPPPLSRDGLPDDVAAAAAKPENLFGAPAEDGHPAHVLLEALARDAMGGVYRAFNRPARRHFAVRFVAGQAEEPQTAAIEKEIRRQIGLPHPHIVPVGGTGRRQNRLYLVSELVQAEPFARMRIPEVSRLARILRDCAEALHYAHEEGVFHGDLNPENILIESRDGADHAWVKDFALGYLLETVAFRASSSRPDLMVRNPAYLSPEQTQDVKRTLSVSGDVYGLGATLYAALAGRPPFEGKDVRQVRSRVMMMDPAPLETVRPETPPLLAAVVRRAMAKESSIRYGTAQEMADALTRFLEGAGTRVRINPAVSSPAPDPP